MFKIITSGNIQHSTAMDLAGSFSESAEIVRADDLVDALLHSLPRE